MFRAALVGAVSPGQSLGALLLSTLLRYYTRCLFGKSINTYLWSEASEHSVGILITEQVGVEVDGLEA